jgi:hypothetical protein
MRSRPTRLLIVPYLHERKLFLNTKKLATDYFYTSVTTKATQEQKYYAALELVRQQGGKARDVDILEALYEPPAPKNLQRRKSLIGVVGDNLSSHSGKNTTDKEGAAQFTSIVCVKVNQSKYYVYSQNGVLLNRVDFSNLTEAYGMPVSTSSNG